MILLPILVRELRVAARRKSTYRARLWSATAAVGVGAVLLLTLHFGRVPLLPQTGLAVFFGLACVGFFHCLLLSFNTADCISEEKREGTLGLLFLTDLSGWDVAVGKLCANSIQSFYAVLGTFPVLAVVLILGGVSIRQFCTVALALLNVFFFAHAAGLLASVMTRAMGWAHAATGALLVGFLAGPPLLTLGISHGMFIPSALLLATLSPGYALVQSMLPIGVHFYWFSLLIVHLEAWLFLALASWRLPHCWQEKAGPARLRWRDRFRQWTYGPPAFREGLRRNLVGFNPFLWLVSRNRLTPLIFPLLLLLVNGLWFWAWIESNPRDRFGIVISIVCTNHLLLLGGVSVEASSHLQEQRRSGALDFVLCSTPLQVGDILAAHWELLRRRFFRPLILVLALDIVLVVLSQTRLVCGDSGDLTQLVWFVGGVMLMLLVDAVAAGWVGMWRAMAQRLGRRTSGARTAAVETIGLLLLAPAMGLWMIPMTLLLLGHEDFLDLYFDTFFPVFGVWFLLSLSAAFGFSFVARRSLLTRFREMARLDCGERVGILGKLGRLLGSAFRRPRSGGATSPSRP
jgi:ABC-type transport system involved in multi-copper enzyme maturation permease subunit